MPLNGKIGIKTTKPKPTPTKKPTPMRDYGYTKVEIGSPFDKRQQALFKKMKEINERPAKELAKRMNRDSQSKPVQVIPKSPTH
jgi:hypothetical protein